MNLSLRAGLVGALLAFAASTVARAQPAASPTAPTTPVNSAPPARVMLQIDSATFDRFDVRSFDLGVTGSPIDSLHAATSAAELILVKAAGAYTGDLVRLGASGQHVPFGTVEALDSLGHAILTLRIYDVRVMSDHVTLSTARANLEQQRIGLEESLAQLSTEYEQAQRDLATAEELAKTRGAARQDLARAREHAAEVARRVDLAKQRQTLVLRQLQSQGALDETVILHFSRMEIETPAPGGKAQWEFRPERTRK